MTDGLNQVMGGVAPQVDPAAMQAPIQQEKVLTQSEVNEIVRRRTAEAAERARQEERAALAQVAQQQSQSGGSLGGMSNPNLTAEQVRQMIAEERQAQATAYEQSVEQRRQASIQAEYDGLIGRSRSRLVQAEQKYPDIGQVVQRLKLDFGRNSVILQLADQLGDKMPDVLYDLGKPGNEAKMTTIFGLLQNGHDEVALEKLQSLANSIAVNEKAAQQRQPEPPLSTFSASVSSTGSDNGERTVADFKQRYRGGRVPKR